MSNSWIPVALTALVCACVLSEMNANPVTFEETAKNGEKTNSGGCGGKIEKTDGGKECNSSYDKKGETGNDSNDEKVCDNKGKDDQLCENANGGKNSNHGNSDKECNSDYDNKGGGNDGIKEKNCWKYPRSNDGNITKGSDTNYDNNSKQKCVIGNNTKDINGSSDSNCNKGDDISNNGHPYDHRGHTRNRHVKERKNIIKEKQKCSNLCKDIVHGNKHNRGTKITSCNKSKIVTQKVKVIEIAKVKTKLSKSAHTSKPKPFNEGNCSTREDGGQEYKNGNDLKGSCCANEDNGGKDGKKDNFRNCENNDDNQCIEKKEQKCDNSSKLNPEHNPGNTSSDGKDDNCSKNAKDQKECVKEIGVKCKKADNIEIKEKYKHECDNSNGGIHDTGCGKDNVDGNKHNRGTKIASCNKCKIVTQKTKVIEIAKVKTKLSKSAHTSKPKPFNEGNCSTREEYKNGNDLKGSCCTIEDNGGKDGKKDNFRNCENNDDNQCIEKKEQKCDNSSKLNPEHNPGNTSSDGKDDNCSKNAKDQKKCVKEIGVKCKKADNIEIKEKYKHECDNSNGGIHDTGCGKDNVDGNKHNRGTKIASCNKSKIVTQKVKVIEIAKVKTKLTKSCALKRKTLKGKRANGDEVVDNSSVLNEGCCNKDEDQSNDGNRAKKSTNNNGIIEGDCKEGNGSKIDEGGKVDDK